MQSDIKQAKKAIAIFNKVLSKKQEDGYSIDSQKRSLAEYCVNNGLELIKTFELNQSSTVDNNQKFDKLLEFVGTQKETIAIVTDKIDRLQRRFKEIPLLNDLIEKESIELHFYEENLVISKNSTSSDKLRWNMHVILANAYEDEICNSTNRNVEQNLHLGRYSWEKRFYDYFFLNMKIIRNKK